MLCRKASHENTALKMLEHFKSFNLYFIYYLLPHSATKVENNFKNQLLVDKFQDIVYTFVSRHRLHFNGESVSQDR